MYYAERLVELPRADLADAVRTATSRPSRLLMLDAAALPQLAERSVPHQEVLRGTDWALVRIRRGARRALEASSPPP
jgi:hypothetical protein